MTVFQNIEWFKAHAEYGHWREIETGSIVPDAEETLVMEAVGKALDAGLHYNKDVDAHVKAALNIPDAAFDPREWRTAGGVAGTVVYCARKVVEARRDKARNTEAAKRFHSGDVFKNVYVGHGHTFSTFTVLDVDAEAGAVKFSGKKRGTRNQWQGTISASRLKSEVESRE